MKKERFTVLKTALLVCLIGVGYYTQAQSSGNLFLPFTTEDPLVTPSAGTNNTDDGTFVAASVGGRQDVEYSWDDGAHSFTLNPSVDVYMAVKFIGDVPFGTDAKDYTRVYCNGSWGSIDIKEGGGIQNMVIHTTAGGNQVLYFKINEQNNTTAWTGAADFTTDRLIFYYRFTPTEFNWEIDWLGTFTTVADIEAMAAAQDDGTSDDHETAPSDRLSDISVGGTSIPAFSGSVTSYNYVLPAGTSSVPTITATAEDAGAQVDITQAASLPGTATIVLTATDNSTNTYTIDLSVWEAKDQLFISMSDDTQNALLSTKDKNTANHTISDGHMQIAGVAEGSGYRQDWEYGFNDGTEQSVFINPLRDVYFAVKFIGPLYDGFVYTGGSPFDFFTSIKSTGVTSSHVVSTLSVGDFDLSNYITASGNEVIYVKLEDMGNADWNNLIAAATTGVGNGELQSSYDVYADQLEFKFRPAPVPFDWNIDFVGFFETEQAIMDAADGMDDGSGDFDEAVTWDGTNWSATPSEHVPATLNANYTGAGFTCAALNVGTNELTITSGTLDVKGDLVGSGAINIASGASLLTYEGMNVANVTINRNTNGSALGYSFVGSPVISDPTITGATIGSPVYSYNETQAYSATGGARWVNATSTQLVAGVGYAQAGQSSVSFTGTPNSGDVTVAGVTYSAGTASEQGWNLLSNPYPAAISAQAFINANTSLDAAIYLWDDKNDGTQGTNNDYLTVTNLGAVGTGPNGGSYSGYIGAAQGFFVKVAAQGTTDVTFTEAMRVAGNNDDASFFRKADRDPLNIKLALTSADGNLYNETLIGLREDATSGNDRGYDAAKLIGNSDIALYSLMEDQPMAIQGLPLVEGTSTELAFNLAVAAEMTLRVSELTGLTEGMTYILTDQLTGKTYDLNEVNEITFSAAQGSNQNRFRLTYGTKTILGAEAELKTVFKTLDDRIELSFGELVDVQGYVLYDLSGKIISQEEAASQTRQLIIPVNNKGIKVLKVFTAQGQITRKFLF